MILYLLLFFILGSAVGSFLNVVADRTMRNESISGRSHCENCGKTLTVLDLVPILSFLGLRAKCRYCGTPLSWQYPAVESLTAVLFATSFWVLVQNGDFSFVKLFLFFVLASVSVVVAVVDLKFSLIPTTFLYATSLFALFYNFFAYSPAIFFDGVIAAFGAALFFLVIVLITFGRGMGQGDIVLAFFMGMVLGVKATVLAMFLAFFSGAVISIFLIFLNKKKFGNTIPFGPFLVFGFLISLFWSAPVLSWWFGMLY